MPLNVISKIIKSMSKLTGSHSSPTNNQTSPHGFRCLQPNLMCLGVSERLNRSTLKARGSRGAETERRREQRVRCEDSARVCVCVCLESRATG